MEYPSFTALGVTVCVLLRDEVTVLLWVCTQVYVQHFYSLLMFTLFKNRCKKYVQCICCEGR